MARLLGTILVLTPIGIVLALFFYWLRKRYRRDVIAEDQYQSTTKEK